MTQKELLYIDDTLGHLKYLITATNHAIEQVTDDDLADFLSDIESDFAKEEKNIEKLLEG